MKLMKKAAALGSSVSAMLLSATTVLAQAQPPFALVSPESAGFQIDDLGRLLQGLLNAVLFVSALLVFGYLVWGGVQWITSGGDKGKTEEARNKITAAIVGLAVVAASYAIFRVVLWVVGIDDPFTTGLPAQIKLYE